MSLQATSGAASYDAFGGGVPAAPPTYIEDVFSCFLYTGTGASQTITNNIDLSTKGGLTWIKGRSGATGHRLTDTARGVTKSLASNSNAAQATESTGLTAFGTTGFTIGADADYNTSSATYASWTFRKQPKFFDVVTYTGTGVARTVAHNLGSVPACIIVKRTNTAGFDWLVYHISTGNTNRLLLNDIVAEDAATSYWNDTTPTSTVFTVGTDVNGNASGATYIAYLFAHDAGGFGLTGTDNVISCGTFTTNASGGATVSLGYEPQWVMTKSNTTQTDWRIFDDMRGMSMSTDNLLIANTSGAESTGTDYINPTATGFVIPANGNYAGSQTFIYIAIRRGPMKVPTDATKVFTSSTYTGTGTSQTVTSGLQTASGSLVVIQDRTNGSASRVYSGLRGVFQEIYTQSTAAEVDRTGIDAGLKAFNMNGFSLGSYNYNGTNENGITYVGWQFRRAPSFFDEVCYTGTGSNTTITHNLGAVPELIIVKGRSGATAWESYCSALANTEYLVLNTTAAKATGATRWNSTTPTSSVFSIGTSGTTNTNAATYVAYLFATCAGVSKVGSYSGTGTTLQINCGFTAGARFVLIKRTDSTGDWYVWDTARGIVSGNDPYLLLNSTAAEVTSTDYIDTYSAGFEISSTAPAAINASAGTFIFLAIA